MNTISVETPSASYTIECGRGALAQAGALVAALGPSSGVYLLSSPVVWKHLLREATRGFGRAAAARTILFPDAEQAKTLRTVESLCRALVYAGADRRALLIAVGGGVVGDVAGFAAATYLRGVGLVHVPTTLVAQVDSSIGGKTGVNLPEGKNLVGAFYPPRLVITDPGFLETLPDREFRSGLYEVVKYAVISDAALFDFLERRMPALLRRDSAALRFVIPCCIRLKASVVNRDEHETGLRQILNFGHTLGHGLEAVTGYRRFLHGEAIGWGMIASTLLALARGGLRERDASRIIRSSEER